ncbi:SWIM zinc finger family protein [Massilia putida]|uniref:SWIM zinc finger family protein n=1 Tax=Massilia putida TaxID=1141883 RepID=UPI0009531527|nr:SWIM zinc finger family protein [Massilia putida]
MTLDANQILALAPDSASARAGSQLAAPRNWSNLGTSDVALWGECQGSGKTPYRTQIDLGGPAFKCTCPSRKFPCKHGLGLYLLCTAEPALFEQGDEPAWVRDWLQNRQVRQEKKVSATTLPNPEAAAQARKREEKREDKVDAGLLELQTWLHDLAREGLASVRSRGQGFWDAIAARMADAQAAPLARRLRRTGSMLYQSGLRNAETLVANELASLYLLTQAWQRIDQLAPALQADVRALLGWTMSQDEVLRQRPVADRWRVLAQSTFDDDRLRARATWLHGASQGRWALHLQYAVGTQGFDQQLAPGTAFDGELCFYPSAYPLRAQIRRQDEAWPLSADLEPSDLDGLLGTYADALAAQPFLERHPVLLGGLVPDDADRGIVRDAHGRRIALHPAFRHPLHLLALSGGHPLTVCGEWDGRMLLPLSVWHDGRLYNIDSDFI